MTAYKSQMTGQFMGYCYKTNLSNEFPKYSVVGVSLEEFAFKPLSPGFKSAYRKLQKLFFFFNRKREKEKQHVVFFFSALKWMLLKHITPYLTGGGKKSTFWNWASVFFDSTKATVPTLSNATRRLLLQLILYSLHQSFGKGGREKTESERAKETSSSEPLMTRAKHVEGKSPNSGYSFSIPWQAAKLNISAG